MAEADTSTVDGRQLRADARRNVGRGRVEAGYPWFGEEESVRRRGQASLIVGRLARGRLLRRRVDELTFRPNLLSLRATSERSQMTFRRRPPWTKCRRPQERDRLRRRSLLLEKGAAGLS
jgi:hypothetical protein